ncbi:lipoprotein insertase outer membrane protein LolB [Noviherbaspirillum agri]
MTRRRFLQRAFAGALPMFIASCASIAPPRGGSEPTPSGVAATRTFHEMIDLGGRLSVHYQSRQGEEAVHGSFVWTQTPGQTAVTLLSPLGQTLAVIAVTPDFATLRQAGKMARSASDVDVLTAEALGWPLPVAGLREWLQGFAVDRAGRRFIATPTTDEVVTRDGWRIRYVNWQDGDASAIAQHRPKRIDLARFTEQAGDVSIRIIIDTWQAR